MSSDTEPQGPTIRFLQGISYEVRDLDVALAFYCDGLGMALLRRVDAMPPRQRRFFSRLRRNQGQLHSRSYAVLDLGYGLELTLRQSPNPADDAGDDPRPSAPSSPFTLSVIVAGIEELYDGSRARGVEYVAPLHESVGDDGEPLFKSMMCLDPDGNSIFLSEHKQ